jgi:hypothetical protein
VAARSDLCAAVRFHHGQVVRRRVVEPHVAEQLGTVIPGDLAIEAGVRIHGSSDLSPYLLPSSEQDKRAFPM